MSPILVFIEKRLRAQVRYGFGRSIKIHLCLNLKMDKVGFEPTVSLTTHQLSKLAF